LPIFPLHGAIGEREGFSTDVPLKITKLLTLGALFKLRSLNEMLWWL